MKRCIDSAYSCGTKYICFMEGVWTQHYDLFEDLPKGVYIAALEGDDIIEFKKRFGDKIAVAGGIKQGMLKYSSVEECNEYVKKVFDACAPGGGFIFTLDKAIVDSSDVNAETMRAVNEFAHEYGKYQEDDLKKTVLELVEEYVDKNMPQATEAEKKKAVEANVIALLRVQIYAIGTTDFNETATLQDSYNSDILSDAGIFVWYKTQPVS